MKLTPEIIESWIAELAKSKGWYGRLLRDWYEYPDHIKEYTCRYYEERGVTDIVEFVLATEG